MNNDFSLESGTGLAAVLKGNWLKVPLNQREYKWEEGNVLDMLRDLANAMRSNRPYYFMGTIVMTRRSDEEWEIADGQQRLATTTIILTVFRDMLLASSDEKRARGYEQDFLFGIDPESSEEVARLTLNADDNDFFYRRILLRPADRDKDLSPQLTSHELLLEAYQTARNYFEDLRSQLGKGFSDSMLQWRKYLLTGAKALVLKVPDTRLAFIMFETLNDRGIKTSEVDLVKNHLFQESGKRVDEAHRSWSAMRGAIESIGDRDDLVMDYVRSAACVLYGMTREKEVFDRVSEHSKSPSDAIKMLSALEQMANDYTSLFNPEHSKWNDYPIAIRPVVKTLVDLDVKQMRPLLLSVTKNFSPSELLITLTGLVSWAVRLTVAGGSKAGRLDTFYANLAFEVNNGNIKNYSELLTAAGSNVPKDAEFQSYFETLRVKVSKTARYYLRSLELTAQGVQELAWVPNPDATVVTLEHVMPKTQCPEWPNVTSQDFETHAHRLGNLALLKASENVVADRSPFSVKKPIFQLSSYVLTKMIGDQFNDWGVLEIETRQKKLAEYAPKTWPINF